jgi:hypothetical protein
MHEKRPTNLPQEELPQLDCLGAAPAYFLAIRKLLLGQISRPLFMH